MAFPAYTPKARVQKPAPHFSSQAVVDGTFEGMFDKVDCYCDRNVDDATMLTPCARGQPDKLHVHQAMACPRLHPHGLDFRMPYRDHRL